MKRSVRLLVADDADIVRRGIVRVIADCCDGVEVVGLATDYGGLMRTIESARPDVVLVDLNMPTDIPLDADVLKAHLGSACLLVMSAYFDEASAERARVCGAAELLDKAKLAETLKPAIDRCMDPKRKAATSSRTLPRSRQRSD